MDYYKGRICYSSTSFQQIKIRNLSARQQKLGPKKVPFLSYKISKDCKINWIKTKDVFKGTRKDILKQAVYEKIIIGKTDEIFKYAWKPLKQNNRQAHPAKMKE